MVPSDSFLAKVIDWLGPFLLTYERLHEAERFLKIVSDVRETQEPQQFAYGR